MEENKNAEKWTHLKIVVSIKINVYDSKLTNSVSSPNYLFPYVHHKEK